MFVAHTLSFSLFLFLMGIGTAAGKTYGLAPGANIVSVKVLDKNGSGSNSGTFSFAGKSPTYMCRARFLNFEFLLGGETNQRVSSVLALSLPARHLSTTNKQQE